MWHLFSYAYAIGWPLFFRLLLWSIFPFLVHKVPRTKGSGFWLPVIQVVASFNLLLSIVVNKFFMSMSFIFCDNLKKNPNFSSCSVLLQYQLSIALFSSLVILYLFFMQMSNNFLKMGKRHWLRSCYLWGGYPSFCHLFWLVYTYLLKRWILVSITMFFLFIFSLGWRSTRVWFAVELSHNTRFTIIFYLRQVSDSLILIF